MNDKHTPTIEELLVPFFEHATAQKSGLRLRRVREVERHLREYLESAGYRILTTPSLGILNLERQFHPDDAFVRCMHADDLMYALSGFIEPAWLPDDRVQAGAQVITVEKLMRWLREHNLVVYDEVACALHGLVVAIYRTKRAQRTEAAVRRLGTVRG